MKTLILTCNTGEGHNSTSAAVKECFERHGAVCDMTDALTFLSPLFSATVSRMHSRIYRHIPKAFSVGYRMAEEHPDAFCENSRVYRILTGGANRLYAHLVEHAYDTVICAHVFSGLMMTAVLRAHPELEARTCFIATDYTCSPIVRESTLDTYVIPDESLREDFLQNGIPSEKIVGSGIPVREAFMTRQEYRDRI